MAGSHREKCVPRMKSRGRRIKDVSVDMRSKPRHHQEGRWQLRGLSLLSLSYSRPLWLLAQSTLDGSLLLGPTGWRVSSVARQEAKTGPMGGGEQGEKGERPKMDRERHTERRERWTQAEAGGRQKIELSAWFAGQKDKTKKRQHQQSEWEHRGRRGCGRGSTVEGQVHVGKRR